MAKINVMVYVETFYIDHYIDQHMKHIKVTNDHFILKHHYLS